MRSALLGKKVGMTSVYDNNGERVPCTVVEAGPCYVTTVRSEDRDGYNAIQLGYGEVDKNKINKPLKGQFEKAGTEALRHLKEFKNPDTEYKIGDKITVQEFTPGDIVRVSGTSKGRGFQGVMKRHNFGGVGMQTHGQKDRQRHPGSIGQSSYPSKVMKGMKMAGRMGGERVTIKNLEVVDIIPDQNLILIKGSVPGAQNSLLEIEK